MAQPDDARLTFVGHATVLIEMGGSRLLTDPLLRNRLLGVFRRYGHLEREVIGSVDAVLISHLHHDHLDLPSLRALGSGTPIVGPPGTDGFLRRRGFARVTELAPGDVGEVSGIEVRAVDARHPGGRIFGPGRSECVGYVIDGSRRIYFAGDTELFEGMAHLASGLDVALLPIWGWSPTLGPGHLNPLTAAQALTLIRPRIAIPIHWGTLALPASNRLWPWLLTDPGHRFLEHAQRLAPSVQASLLHPGESLTLNQGGYGS